MSDSSAPQVNPNTFDNVVAAELDYIAEWRKRTGRIADRQLTGLALSGGGIRSAVFCLGVIQALAKHNVLKNFDYLSTVSGGGYIGASLTWFTRPAMVGFGVGPNDLPYGIDDPKQQSPRMPRGKPLLPHLRRHGSYLDPGGGLSLLAGIAVVLRGLVLNLLVIWLPIITTLLVLLRMGYRSLAYVTAYDGRVWLGPLTFSAALAAVFTILAILYSLYSGWRTKIHKDMPYGCRKRFEQITPYVLGLFAALLVLGSLPYVRDLVLQEVLSEGIAGAIMTAGGAALGLWSRLVPKGTKAVKIPVWIGPIAAALVTYGMGLIAYALSGMLFAGGSAVPGGVALTILIVAFAAAIVVGYFVDLNETTLHRFYRDRLMEAFMPDTTAAGTPTGNKAATADTGLLCDMCDVADPKAPYHLINAHLVLTRIDQTGVPKSLVDRWRIRGGDSFVFAPRYSGGVAAGWHETGVNKALSRISLATAMAASGAAVNPDAASSGVGPQRNMVFAMLMALLNIRLGYWLPNPARYGHSLHAPAPNHFDAGLAGVLDRVSQKGKFLAIADGGNFENLGVYELLHRHVQTIVVCDATADAESAFADLHNLLSRAEADFGVTITFAPPPLGPLMPSLGQARFPLGVPFATEPFVVGDIRYQNGDLGKLYYMKPAIFAGLRLHVLGFKGAFPAFPDDSTANQFFDEARFEAYRELGFACVDKMLADTALLSCLSKM